MPVNAIAEWSSFAAPLCKLASDFPYENRISLRETVPFAYISGGTV